MFKSINQSAGVTPSNSPSSNTDHKQKQHLQSLMNASVLSAAQQPSTSANPRYNSLLALQCRDFRSAPGSKIILSDTGGLLAGGGNDLEPLLNKMRETFVDEVHEYDKDVLMKALLSKMEDTFVDTDYEYDTNKSTDSSSTVSSAKGDNTSVSSAKGDNGSVSSRKGASDQCHPEKALADQKRRRKRDLLL
ncbi:MAG: hypothetical protein P8077_09570 [Gammaproteobacteria bacterium]